MAGSVVDEPGECSASASGVIAFEASVDERSKCGLASAGECSGASEDAADYMYGLPRLRGDGVLFTSCVSLGLSVSGFFSRVPASSSVFPSG